MIFNESVLQVRYYLSEGTKNILKNDVLFEIKRHVRAHYIGLSNLTLCGRMMHLKYFKPELVKKEEFPDKNLRIFDLGHIIEDMTLKILIAGGASVEGGQTQFTDFDGIVKGHADSILDKDTILEIKSMNQHSFDNLISLGVKISHPTYYSQIQMYMYYSGLRKAILVATCKNNSDIEVQNVEYDQENVDFNLNKLKSVVYGKFYTIDKPYIPDSIEGCKFCPLINICHKGPSSE